MRIEYKDFIGIYNDVYPEGYCQHLISEFERLKKDGAGYNRQSGKNRSLKHQKDDYQIGLNFKTLTSQPFNSRETVDVFFDGLQNCFEEYTNEYSILKDVSLHATHMKMQRTDPGGGYHVWHAEQGDLETADRVLVYSLYLNTLTEEEGGETEFLYQKLRIPPVENTLIIWPAAYTHAHRGNLVLGDKSKYIVTGWFYLN